MTSKQEQRNYIFSEKWLQLLDFNGDYIFEWCLPRDESHLVSCQWCQIDLNITVKGPTALKQHSQGVKHKNHRNMKKCPTSVTLSTSELVALKGSTERVPSFSHGKKRSEISDDDEQMTNLYEEKIKFLQNCTQMSPKLREHRKAEKRQHYFRENWLEKKDANGDCISLWGNQTTDTQVIACMWCNVTLNITAKGASTLKQHSQGCGHKQRRELMLHDANSREPVSAIDNSIRSASRLLKDLVPQFVDSITESSPLTQFTQKYPSGPQLTYLTYNCFVCNVALDSSNNHKALKAVTTVTETPIHEILRCCVGASFSLSQINQSRICQTCVISLEMYDELVYQSEEIQHRLKTLLLKTHSEKVSCKEEPEEDPEEEPELEIEDEVIQRNSQLILNSSKGSFAESNANVKDEVLKSVFIDCNVESLPSESSDAIGEIDKAFRMKVREAIGATGEVECQQPQCKAIFRSVKKYFTHIKIHKPREGKLFCTTCSLNFRSKSNLELHKVTDHIDRGTGSFRSFNCPVCQKSFQTRKALRDHHYSHSSENKTHNSFLCGTCGAIFMNRRSYKRHMTAHDKADDDDDEIISIISAIYECKFCPGRRFTKQWGLDLHRKRYHGGADVNPDSPKTSKPELKIHPLNEDTSSDDDDE